MAPILDLQQLLREAALRVTRPRVAVLRAVYAHPHADTDWIIGVARTELPGVSHQAVYDSLQALTAAGLVRRIQPPAPWLATDGRGNGPGSSTAIPDPLIAPVTEGF